MGNRIVNPGRLAQGDTVYSEFKDAARDLDLGRIANLFANQTLANGAIAKNLILVVILFARSYEYEFLVIFQFKVKDLDLGSKHNLISR